MKNRHILMNLAAAALLSAGMAMTAYGADYVIYVSNNYDTEQTSMDDNDDEKIHPLEPDVYSDDYEIIDDVSWSKSAVNWTPGNYVTGTIYIDLDSSSAAAIGENRTDIRIDGEGRNEVEITSVDRYTGSKYEEDYPDGRIYRVKFRYQVAAQLGDTSWAGWDEANPTVARWNSVKYANTYRVTLYDDQGSVVTQKVEGATSYDFSQFMTKTGIQYYFDVAAIARNGDQQDYLEDGGTVSSLASASSNPGITDGTWGDYQQGRRFTRADGSVPASCWERINGKWYYFNEEGYAVTGWQQIGGIWYYLYEDGSMAAGTTTPDGYQVDASGAWIQ